MTKLCLFCGSTRKRTKFCSLKCQAAFNWTQKREEIIKGDKSHSMRTIKRLILEQQGHCCSVCKLTEWLGSPVPLVLDHIDGNPENNLVSNFRLVCGNCDMQLPTYKSKNIGNGRASRRKRYADGKSY